MQIKDELYDVSIIGGGLAGLSSAILLSRKGFKVVLIEKNKYPFHRVCGEYISLESWNFLTDLGLNLKNLDIPIINKLIISSPSGKSLITTLPLGGFGISRYYLDYALAEIAKKNGVIFLEETKVENVEYNEVHQVTYINNIGSFKITSKVCLGCFGKKSNLDIKWKRSFLEKKDKRLENYIGVKYHIKSNWPSHLIGLHNFKNGYCGISKIENGIHCLCYLSNAENLKRNSNAIKLLEQNVLCKNKYLKKILKESEFIEGFPVTISQINFNKKNVIENHILMLGDAAGMITPLCGNGMSMAFHSAKICYLLVEKFLNNKISREKFELEYTIEHRRNFSSRLQTGRIIQRFFGNEKLSDFLINMVKTFPFIAKPIISSTHGKPF